MTALSLKPSGTSDGTELYAGVDTSGNIKLYPKPSGGGSPAGSGTELQYRNAGAFGAMSGTAWDDTNRALTLTGATVTTSNPVLNLTQTWNAAGVTFTGLKFNATSTASASGSLLLDLQVGGTSKFNVDRTGVVTAAGDISTNGSVSVSAGLANLTGNGLGLAGTRYVGWGASNPNVVDLTLYRDAANTLAQRNGTNAQALRVYNAYTDASNYEYGGFEWASNVLKIGTQKAGTGATRGIDIYIGGSAALSIGTDQGFTFGSSSYAVIPTIVQASTAFRGDSTGMSVGSGAWFAFGSTSNPNNGRDTAVVRAAAKVIKITDASTGNGGIAFITKAGAFVAADVPADSVAFGYDSSGGARYVLMNQGGTLYKVALA